MSQKIGYPNYMRELIKVVEETRDKRLKERYRRFTPEEKVELLKTWHPDYKEGTKRPIRIGPSAGLMVPHEIADLIEAYPLIKPNDVDLSRVDYDVDILIIGGGGAGTTAAIWANIEGIPSENILIATKLRFGDANTKMAQGGIQAADRPNDSPTRHFIDIMGGGGYTNDPELVRELVLDAPFMIKWLEDLGVVFDKEPDGTMIEVSGGGTSRNRMHSCKDYTGLEIMRVLMDEALNRGIRILEFCPAIELLTDDSNRVTGAILWNMETKEYYVVRVKAIILATGGYGRLHIQNYPTTNHYGATMDGVVLAYRVGALLRDLDATQYHPTGAAYPDQILGLLITEKVRSMGGQLVNIDGEQFVYPLETRDAVSAAIIRECYSRNKGIVTPTGIRGVWLDTPMVDMIRGEEATKKYLSSVYRMYYRFGIDVTKEPVLVFPTLHYMNGGVCINKYAQVLGPNGIIDGFFAAGETTGGVHGKNRLMGNSLLEVIVYGRIAGISAAKYVKSRVEPGKLTLNHLIKYINELEKIGAPRDRRAPILLPDYRGKEVLSKAIPIFPI
ncbi:MAG: FAD-binding protein [Candidatus Methanomethylicia archaeon]|nr:FAD-binding protein [Candidatus Methanomethylicia archaeon]